MKIIRRPKSDRSAREGSRASNIDRKKKSSRWVWCPGPRAMSRMFRHVEDGTPGGVDAHLDIVVPEVLPGVAELKEDRVRHGLPREGRTRRAERHGRLVLGRHRQDLLHLVLVVHLDDDLREETIEGRVRAVRERLHGIRVETFLRDQFPDLRLEVRVSPVVDATAVDVGVLRQPRRDGHGVDRTAMVGGARGHGRLRGNRRLARLLRRPQQSGGARSDGRDGPEKLGDASLPPHRARRALG